MAAVSLDMHRERAKRRLRENARQARRHATPADHQRIGLVIGLLHDGTITLSDAEALIARVRDGQRDREQLAA